MSKWSLQSLGSVAEVYDGPHATPRKVNEGPWYLNIASLKNGRVDLSESTHIHRDDVPKWTKRVSPRPGDTLFSYETRLGEAGYWDRGDDAALGRRMGLLRPRPGKVNPRFLTYAYLSKQFQERIRIGTLHGVTVDRIPVGDLPKWQIALPPLAEQERIAGVLGAFDDLIEVNRLLIESVLTLTRSTYDDAKNRAAGTVPLGDLVVVNPEKTKPGLAGERINYLDIGSLADAHLGTPTTLTWDIAPSRARQLAAPGDTLWATVRPNRRGHGLLVRDIADLIVSTGIAILRPKAVPMSLVFAHTDAQTFVDGLVLRGDGSAYPAVRPKDFVAMQVPKLTDEDVTVFREVLDPMWSVVGDLEQEIADLTRQRDELLPLLMSGKVVVGAEGVPVP